MIEYFCRKRLKTVGNDCNKLNMTWITRGFNAMNRRKKYGKLKFIDQWEIPFKRPTRNAELKWQKMTREIKVNTNTLTYTLRILYIIHSVQWLVWGSMTVLCFRDCFQFTNCIWSNDCIRTCVVVGVQTSTIRR